MSYNYDKLSVTEVRELYRKWREDNERRSDDTVQLWLDVLKEKAHKLGNERHLVLEQVIIAGLDSGRVDVVDECIAELNTEFPNSLRVQKYEAMRLEALGLFDDAVDLLDEIIEKDETNAAARKRKVAILKAKGKNVEAIKELCEYLKKFMADQEAWHELCSLYLAEGDYNKALFCMEEVLLHNRHSHLIHQRLGEIRYTMGGADNIEIAKTYYLHAYKLNPKNLRVLYGLYLCYKHTPISKIPSGKRTETQALADHVLDQISNLTPKADTKYISALESAFGGLNIKST